jgi:leader peptidase (prepilin peptidase)/N-methyltransferase
MTAAHHGVLALLSLVLGSCVGSFLNVCAYRMPRALSLFRPRSRCPSCLSAIRFRDKVPVLGWLFLQGKCRDCRGRISPRYPVVETAAGLSFAGVYLAGLAFATGDLWEQMGARGVLTCLLVSWAVIGLVVVGILIGYDRATIHCPRCRSLESAGRRST